jgi:hypothetical protein
MGEQTDSEAILAGPRGRRLCLALLEAGSVVDRLEFQAMAYGMNPDELVSILQHGIDHAAVSWLAASTDQQALVTALAESVAHAMYWQEPDEIDQALADPRMTGLLAPVAEVITTVAGDWWAPSMPLGKQVYVHSVPGSGVGVRGDHGTDRARHGVRCAARPAGAGVAAAVSSCARAGGPARRCRPSGRRRGPRVKPADGTTANEGSMSWRPPRHPRIVSE